jgi:TonB-linked SusC/RagA family outer membrane protein
MNKKNTFKAANGILTFAIALMIVFFGCNSAVLYGQQNSIKVTGKVVDKTDLPLVGVSILEKGTQNGTSTDENGRFTINVKSPNSLLQFSYIGFSPQEIGLGGKTELSVVLIENATNMDEIVVIGYGTTTKKEVTGSISNIKSENFIKGNISDPMQLLQGQIAGMSVVKSSGGDPNGSYSIQLRGMTTLAGGASPLIVIDGVIGGNINSINPEEIESIDVLKDGSAAAIYGTRGTSGVVLITTKRATGSDKTAVEFSSYVAVQSYAKKMEVLNADEFRYVINTYYPQFESLYDFGASTDWFKEISNQNPVTQYYNLAFSGSSANFGYRASLSYQDEIGIIKKTSTNRLKGRINAYQKMYNGKLNIDYSLSYGSSKGELADTWVMQQAARRNPTEPVYDTEGKTPVSGGYYYNAGPFQYYNPVAMIDQSTKDNERRDFMGSIKATLEILHGLKASALGSVSQTGNNLSVYYGRYYPLTFGTNGEAQITKSSGTNRLLELNLDYKKNFGEHSLQAIAGYSYNDIVSENNYSRNISFDTDMFLYNNIGAGAGLAKGLGSMTSYKGSSKLIAFFGRLMYNYRERYLLSASLRYEGSSRFGANYKYGLFPAISAGWRINKEDFMQNLKWVEDLKLRVGYGVTGNQEIGDYRSLQLLTTDKYFYYNGNWIRTYRPASNPNRDLRWERKGELNIGLDFATLKGRLSATLDYYNRTTRDLLYTYTVPVPPNLYNQLFTNVGTIRNTGVELTIKSNPVQIKDFKWNSTLTLASNKNKMVKFSNDQYAMVQIRTGYMDTDLKTYLERIVEGGPIGDFWGPRFAGIDANGQNLFYKKDGTKSGTITEDDYTVIGNAYPKLTFGFTNTFNYKNWDLSFLFRGALGNDVANMSRIYYEGFNYFGGKNILKSTLDWPEFKGSSVWSDRFVEDGSYVKLDNLTLGYNIKYKNDLKMRFYVTGQNLLTITGYKGIDPEVNLSGLEPGIDYYSFYPRTRTFLLGVNINF